jgi:hypothetical protein
MVWSSLLLSRTSLHSQVASEPLRSQRMQAAALLRSALVRFAADIHQFCSTCGIRAAGRGERGPPEARFTSFRLLRWTTLILMSLRLRQLATWMAETVDTISRPKIRCETSAVLGYTSRTPRAHSRRTLTRLLPNRCFRVLRLSPYKSQGSSDFD